MTVETSDVSRMLSVTPAKAGVQIEERGGRYFRRQPYPVAISVSSRAPHSVHEPS
jgi:hypothetical protein